LMAAPFFYFEIINPQYSVATKFVSTSQLDALEPEVATQYHFIVMYDLPAAVSFCGIESLARLSGARIIIWSSTMQLPSYLPKNIDVRNLDIAAEFHGTPFQNFDFIGRYGKQNIANALRLALVYNYGGMYMDTDFIVFQSLDDIPDGMGLYAQGKYNNAAFKFSRPRAPFLGACMEDFVEKYNGDLWGNQGPALFTRIQDARERKRDGEEHEMYPSAWAMESFYPVPFSNMSPFWSTEALQLNRSLALHVWNKLSADKEYELCLVPRLYNTTAIGMLRAAHCPKTFALLQQKCSFKPA